MVLKYLVRGDYIMCIFCGGTCGGVGDALLPSASIGISLAVLKIQAVRASHKRKLKEKAGQKKKARPDSLVS
jgi:mannose/fructose/N-acetylgalactosamine-specific phosphotransferase system component IIC